MPIRPEQRAKYPADWKAIGVRIRERAGNRCECVGECDIDHGGRCTRINGEPIPRRSDTECGSVRVFLHPTVLTIAHLDHDPTHNADDNLRAFCQRCHLRYDRREHAHNSARTRDRKRGQGRFEP